MAPMKKPGENFPYSRPAEPPEPPGLFDETRALYGRLVDEAVRRAERDREEAKARGPLSRALNAAALGAGVLAAVVFVYGAINFSDAPIRQTPHGYAAKSGAPRTREDFERFKVWEKSVLATFGLTFLLGFGAATSEKRLRRRRDGEA
jgi:hypothetical protein